jgi:rsbT co-antagonist protein RsbR
MTLKISNLEERVEKVEDILSSVAAGDMTARINSEIDDDFTGVEAAIDLLINDLTEELQERKKAQSELENKLRTIQNQQETIRKQQEDMLELSSPVTKVWENILILPVIGTLDSRRTQIMMENLLENIVSTGCTIAILDITGVPTVDTQVANHLVKTITAARLLGAECIISGIRPAIAQTIVHLGIDLSSVKTKATLQDAMRYAFRSSGQKIPDEIDPEDE